MKAPTMFVGLVLAAVLLMSMSQVVKLGQIDIDLSKTEISTSNDG